MNYTTGQLYEMQAGVFSPETLTTTFDGTSGHGAIGTVNLFTVDRDGLVAVLGDCTVDLAGASATVSVGVVGNTAALIPLTTATGFDSTQRLDRTGVIATSVTPNVTPFFPVRAGDIIKLTVATASITGGSVDWQLFFKGFNALNPALDASGNALVSLGTKIDPVNDGITIYENGRYITTIVTATTTVVADYPIFVDEIRVLGGTLGNVTVYNETSATGTAVVPAFTPDKGQVLIGKGANFSIGCTVVTAAASIVTVTWRPQ